MISILIQESYWFHTQSKYYISMKKQIFTTSQHEDFKKYFWVKKNPWKWDTLYLKKAQKYIPYISWIPWVKMVWIWNSLAMSWGSQESDIDLYIVTDNHSMWTVRILTTLIFQLLGVRKTTSKHAGRFCLSFFSTLDGMDFSKFALPHDPYLFFWMMYFQPIYISWDTYNRFLEVNNRWCNLDDFMQIPPPLASLVPHSLTRRIGGGLNAIIKNIFLPKTKKSFQKLWKPFGVIISDDLLKFHNNDIRKDVAKKII